jgi:hypothetical protein
MSYRQEYSYWLTVSGSGAAVDAVAKKLAEERKTPGSCFSGMELDDQKPNDNGGVDLSYTVSDRYGTMGECTDEMREIMQRISDENPEVRIELLANNEEDTAEGHLFVWDSGEYHESHRRTIEPEYRYDDITLRAVLQQLSEAGDTTGEVIVRNILANNTLFRGAST